MRRYAFSLKALDAPSVYVCVCIVLLSCVLYVPFLTLPFLPDDYLQITLARRFGPFNQWRYLLQEPLFRHRATSVVLTYWTDSLFPLSPLACGMSSILLHAVNGLLVYCLGTVRSIGWRHSALTAIIFAIQERHHEAIVWYAAIPELLVCMFGLTALLLWIRWLHAERSSLFLWAAVVTFFVLALLSKESAVAFVILMALFGRLETTRIRRTLLGLIPLIAVSVAYVMWVFAGQEQNHHFHDGTFVLHIGFVKTALLSAARGLWLWGWIALAILVLLRIGKSGLLITALLWVFASLIPYSFLTYAATVPSRHHYIAAVGCSLIIGMALLALQKRMKYSRVILCCLLIIGIHHASYLWLSKYRQFARRSEPIEAFMHFLGSEARRPVVVQCSDYLFAEVQRAAYLRRGEAEEHFVFESAANHRDAPLYCLPRL